MVEVPALVLVHKVPQEERHVSQLQIAALAQLMRYVSRYILRPFLGGGEHSTG
jgi:hypothetical protein